MLSKKGFQNQSLWRFCFGTDGEFEGSCSCRHGSSSGIDMELIRHLCFSLLCVFRVAVEALRILLGRAQLDAVVKPLDQEGAWDKMKDPQQHTTGVTLLSRCTHLSPVIHQFSWTVCCSAMLKEMCITIELFLKTQDVQLQQFDSATRRFQAVVSC